VHCGVCVAHVLLLHACGGGGAALVLQAHDEDLHGLLHQLLPVVGEQQVVVGDPVAHRVVSAYHVQQRGEERQSVPERERERLLYR